MSEKYSVSRRLSFEIRCRNSKPHELASRFIKELVDDTELTAYEFWEVVATIINNTKNFPGDIGDFISDCIDYHVFDHMEFGKIPTDSERRYFRIYITMMEQQPEMIRIKAALSLANYLGDTDYKTLEEVERNDPFTANVAKELNGLIPVIGC